MSVFQAIAQEFTVQRSVTEQLRSDFVTEKASTTQQFDYLHKENVAMRLELQELTALIRGEPTTGAEPSRSRDSAPVSVNLPASSTQTSNDGTTARKDNSYCKPFGASKNAGGDPPALD